MLKEKVEKFYSDQNDLNCAESMLYGANEAYGLGLDKKVLDTMSSFGGGMAVQSVCGALTGALAVLGVMFTGDKSIDAKKRSTIIAEFYRKFEEKLGSDNCKELKEKYRDDVQGCQTVVKLSAEVLDEVVKKYRDAY